MSFVDNVKSQLTQIVPTITLPSIDSEKLISEDIENDRNKNIPWRFGENISVNIDIKSSGVADILANGDKLWRLRIYAAGAYTMNLTFDKYKLPEFAKLFIYNTKKTQVLGAFTNYNNQVDDFFATTLIEGESIIIEYYEPKNVAFPGLLHLSRVTHGYRNVFDFSAKAFGSSGGCNNNVACPEAAGWENQIRASCMLVVNGNGFCSGSLLNNTANDGTPYVMTANHCSGSNNFGSWVFWFNWQSATCVNQPANPAHDQVTTTGCVLKARNAASDFCLVQMNQAPPQNFNVYYAGWSKESVTASSATGIHHPNGDIKKISFANNPTVSATYNNVDSWQAVWADGVTEPGSSGSPLYDSNHRFVGQLYGGPSSCSASQANMTDYYGKLSVSWEGASSVTRAKDWLDPLGTDPPFINGFDPALPEFSLDAAPRAVITPYTSYCIEQNISPSVIIKNFGSSPLTNLIVKYNINSGTYVSHSWSGNLATNDSAIITFPAISIASGDHVFSAVTCDPNGAIDENNANDTIFKIFRINTGILIPFSENFESALLPPTGWEISNPDNNTTWELTANASGNGTSTYAAHINLMEYTADGQTDDLILPKINFTTVTNSQLSFKVAYRRYNDQYSDGLKILISGDCGATFVPIYNKSGLTLATGLDVTQAFYPSVARDWRTETVDLTDFVGNTVIIRFQSINHNGNNLFIDDINIVSDMPPTAGFYADKTSSCSGEINFLNYSTGVPTSYLWNFGDGTTDTAINPVHQYLQDGLYTVKLSVSNPYGNNQFVRTDYISINLPETPTVSSASRCGSGSVTLSATGSGVPYWYDNEFDQTPAMIGNNYATPIISQSTQYFVENHDEESSMFVGNNDTSTFGGNGNFNAEYWLNFVCFAPIRLVSVAVNAGASGIRTIYLRDTLNNNIDSISVDIQPGVSRILLNFNIQPGYYRLAGSKNANLWRNSQNISYPYTIPGLVSITSSNVSSRYYYFYKWEVKVPDCISARIPVTANIYPSLQGGYATIQDTSICTGNTTLLSLTDFAGDINWQSSANNINWQNISTGSLQDSIFETPEITAATWFRAKLTGGACLDEYSNIVHIILNNGPVAGIIAANETTVCINSSVTLNVSGYSGSIQWQTAPSGTSGWTDVLTATNDTYTTDPLMENTWVRAKLTFGLCPDVFSNVISVNISPYPQVGHIYTSTPDVCVGSSSEIGISGYSGTIQWQNSTDNINWNILYGVSSPMFSTPELNTTTYYRAVLKSTNCADAVSDTLAIIAHSPPLATIIINNASFGIHDGTATVFGTGGTWNYTYQWDAGTGNQTTQTVSDLAPGTYLVTIYDGICTSTASCVIQENPSNYPIAHFSIQSNITCTGSSINFNDNSLNNPQTWFWKFSGGVPLTSNIQNPVVTYNTPGVYNVTLIVSNQFGTDTIFSPYIITVTSPGILHFNTTPESVTGATDATATAIVSGGNPPYYYYWNNGENTQTITGLSSGNYSVAVVDASGCFITGPISIDEPTKSNLLTSKTKIEIYPNPTTGILFISNHLNLSINIKITDVIGKTIFTYHDVKTNIKIDLTSLPDGVYFSTIKSSYQSETFKIILTK